MNSLRLRAKLIILILISASVNATFCLLPNVYAQTSTPVPGAAVTAIGLNGFGSSTSDSFGYYNITSSLDTGNYSVTASANGFIDTIMDNVPVTAGLETTNVNLLLPASGGISGTVTDAVSGQPLQGVFVDAENMTGNRSYGSGGITDVNGNYQIITNLNTGTYNVSAVYVPGHITKKITGVSVTAGQMTNNVNIALSRSATISGTVTDSVSSSALEGVLVYAVDNSGNYVATSTTNSTGKYTLNTDLATGTYNITTLFPAGHLPKTIQDFAVVAGSQYTVNLSLDPSGIISGRITNAANGQPLAEVSVLASSDNFFGVATTNSTGYYRISDGLGTGIYTVLVSYAGGFNLTTGVSVTQGSETPNVNLQITVTPSGTITGKVTDSQGQPIQFASVDAEGSSGSGNGITDANGNYAINAGLGTGTYTLTASASGFSSQVQTGVNVVVNQVTSNINFQLTAKLSGRISGQVITQSTPIPEVTNLPLFLGAFVAVTVAIFAIKPKTFRLRTLSQAKISKD